MLNLVLTNPRDRALVVAVTLGAALALPVAAGAMTPKPIANSGLAHRIAPHPIANSGVHADPIANSKVRY